MIETGAAPIGARFVPVVELGVSGPSCPIDGAGDPWSGAIYPGAPVVTPEYDADDYRKCRTCGAATGAFCVSQSGRVVGGLPDGIRTPLPRPHVARQRRAGR